MFRSIFLTTASLLCLVGTAFGQYGGGGGGYVNCSQAALCVIATTLKPCGTTAEYTAAAKPCPNTGCISVTGGYACNNGTPEGGDVFEEAANGTLTEWLRQRLKRTQTPGGQNGKCAVTLGPYYCKTQRKCWCQGGFNSPVTCRTDPTQSAIPLAGTDDVVFNVPEQLCLTP